MNKTKQNKKDQLIKIATSHWLGELCYIICMNNELQCSNINVDATLKIK
jgi:hypothetical protein